jgi:dTDP-6-deoxy-L-talose 4-dehydrogenase (NAD+)
MLKENQYVELTSGKQIRDYIDVKKAGNDIAKYAVGKRNGEINICSGKGVKNMVSKIANKFNKKHLLKFGVRKENPFDPPKVVGIK